MVGRGISAHLDHAWEILSSFRPPRALGMFFQQEVNVVLCLSDAAYSVQWVCATQQHLSCFGNNWLNLKLSSSVFRVKSRIWWKQHLTSIKHGGGKYPVVWQFVAERKNGSTEYQPNQLVLVFYSIIPSLWTPSTNTGRNFWIVSHCPLTCKLRICRWISDMLSGQSSLIFWIGM